MGEKTTVVLFLSIFLIIQLLGIFVGSKYIEGIKEGSVLPVVENPESVASSLLFFSYILIGTGVIILIIKFKKFFIRIIEAVSIFFASWITFDFLIPYEFFFFSIGFYLAVILTAWKMLRPSIISQNTAVIFTASGVGAVIGASFGIAPSIVFMLLLSIYDFVSVFITKHMVYMAKALTERPTAFTVGIPSDLRKITVGKVRDVGKKIHVFQLGAGDIVLPLMFNVSILRAFSLTNTLFAMVGAMIMLGLLIYHVTKNPGKALPALPFISLGSLSGFILSLFI